MLANEELTLRIGNTLLHAWPDSPVKFVLKILRVTMEGGEHALASGKGLPNGTVHKHVSSHSLSGQTSTIDTPSMNAYKVVSEFYRRWLTR